MELEYKREYNPKVKNTMLAFLNTDGGTLYIGIDNDGSVYGIDGDAELEARKVLIFHDIAILPFFISG